MMAPVMKISLKGAMNNRVRLLLTSLAVAFGVAFVSASFIFTDSTIRAFETLFQESSKNVDIYVRPKKKDTDRFGAEMGNESGQANPIPETLALAIKALPEVKSAEGISSGNAVIIDKKGKAVLPQGPPTLGYTWSPDANDLSPLKVVKGTGPTRRGEVAIDVSTAKKAGYVVGDTVKVSINGPAVKFTLVGLLKFGSQNNLAGATLTVFEKHQGQELFGAPGKVGTIAIQKKSGVGIRKASTAIREVVGDDWEVVTAEEVNEETVQQMNDSFITILRGALLAFAGVALFVSAFIIFNTFSIVAAQRTRELALLRLVGASRLQVTRLLVGEAVIVGSLASVIGLGLGVALVPGLNFIMEQSDASIPQSGIIMKGRTVFAAMTIGMLVTVVASVVPAFRAGRTSPIQVLSQVSSGDARGHKGWRFATGILICIASGALIYAGFTDKTPKPATTVGFGAAALVVGITTLSYLLVPAVARVVGLPITFFARTVGTIARENSISNPRRTSSTAAAVMIGLGLVVFASIFASSFKASLQNDIDKVFRADLIAYSGSGGPSAGFPSSFSQEIAELDEVSTATSMRHAYPARIAGSAEYLAAIDPEKISEVVDLELSGQSRTLKLSNDEIIVPDSFAESKKLKIGETVKVELPTMDKPQKFKVAAISGNEMIAYTPMVSHSSYDAMVEKPRDDLIWINSSKRASAGESRKAVENLAKKYGVININDQTELQEEQSKQIDQGLAAIIGLLFLAILIAAIGIINTMFLSVFERTREIGLLRAVGMTRRGAMGMIEAEALITGVFGAVLGVAVGITGGWISIRALRDEGLTSFDIHLGQIAVFIVLSAFVALLAGIWPAIRAARMNVINALSQD